MRSRVFMQRTTHRPKKNDAPTAHEAGLAKNVPPAEDLPPRRLSGLLSEAAKIFEQKLTDDEAFRSTLAEYLRLLRAERDLQLQTPVVTTSIPEVYSEIQGIIESDGQWKKPGNL